MLDKEYLFQQLERSFYPINDIKRLSVLHKQELNNLKNHVRKGATPEHVAKQLEELAKEMNELSNLACSLELYVRSVKNQLGNELGKNVNKHE